MQYIAFPATATGYVYAILRDHNCIPPHTYVVDRLVPPVPGNKAFIKFNNEELTINVLMRIKQAGYFVGFEVVGRPAGPGGPGGGGDGGGTGPGPGPGPGPGGNGGGGVTPPAGASTWDAGASEWDAGASTWD